MTTENLQNRNSMTCGEYLSRERQKLGGIRDLGTPGAVDDAIDCLSRIYAVSYQMNFERREPPSPHRGPAEEERLDDGLIREMSEGLKNKVDTFGSMKEDPWRLSRAMVVAQQGNGFPLIEMVCRDFTEKRAQEASPAKEAEAVRTNEKTADAERTLKRPELSAPVRSL